MTSCVDVKDDCPECGHSPLEAERLERILGEKDELIDRLLEALDQDEIDRLTADNKQLRLDRDGLCDEILRMDGSIADRLREEVMGSYDSLTRVKQARYSGPEDYADAVLRSEAAKEKS